MKTISIPLPETIGVKSGYRLDGTIAGSVLAQDPDKIFYRSSLLNTAQFFTEDKTALGDTIKEVTTAATNDVVGDTVIFPNPSVGDSFITLIPSTATIDEIHYRVSTAGSGITYAHEYWATDYTWKPLTVTLGATGFLASTGILDFEFTVPADWALRPIDADTGTFVGKVIRHRITAVSTPVSPICTRLYPGSTTFTNNDVTAPLTNLSLSPPSIIALTDERWCMVSAIKPFGLKIVYKEAQVGGGNKLSYSTGTSITDIIGYTDTSSGMTTRNDRTFTPKRLTATAVSATAVTIQRLTGDGYIESGVNAVPTASTGRFSIGLSSATSGNIDYELRADYTGGNPRLTVYENNVLQYTHTVNITTSDTIRVYRYNNTVIYMLGDNVIYTSITASIANLYGRVFATDNNVIVPNIRLVDFSTSSAYPLAITFTVTSMTATDEASTTEQFLAKHYIKFEPPVGMAALTAVQSDVGVSGYQICIVNTTGASNTQVDTLAKIQNVQILPMTGANVEGIAIKGTPSYTSANMQITDPSTITQASKFLIFNGISGVSTSITYPALDNFEAITPSSISFADEDKLVVSQISGNDTSDIGFGSYLILAEA